MSSYYFIGQTFDGPVIGTTATFSGNVTSGGQFLAADGTAAAPGYAYTSQAGTGIFRPASGVVGLTGAGVEVARFSSTLAQIPAAALLTWNGFATIQSPADGILALENNAGTGFTRLQLGGTTASFPAIKRNAAALNFRLADDSADAAITTAAITASGTFAGTAGTFSTTLGVTGVLTAVAAGSVTAPSISLVAANTGLYQSATNTVDITTAGVLAATFDASQKTILAGNAVINGTQGLYIKGKGAAGPIADVNVPFQIDSGTAGSQKVAYFGANKAGGYGFLCGFSNDSAATGGVGGTFRMVTTDPFSIVMNNATLSTQWVSSGQVKGMRPVTLTKTTAYPVVIADSYTCFNNTAASGQVVYTLPASAVGLNFTFQNTAAGATFTQLLATTPDVFASNGVVGAAAGTITSTQIWSMVTVTCFVAGTWQVTSLNGAWTIA